MRAVLQRVSEASVRVGEETVARIGRGLLVLLGIAGDDDAEEVRWMAQKIAGLRIFPDEHGRFDHSVRESRGAVLVVSQFTLLGDASRGRRPSFSRAAAPERADELYREVAEAVAAQGIAVETGRFGAHMSVCLVNDGPVTIVLDSAERSGRR